MTDTENAPVTREHRERALRATYPVTEGGKWPAEHHWVETGYSLATASIQLFLPRVAQAIANAEARGARSRDAEVAELHAKIDAASRYASYQVHLAVLRRVADGPRRARQLLAFLMLAGGGAP